MPANKPKKDVTTDELVKISFLVKSEFVGAFFVQFADKVQVLEVSPVVAVPYDKNKPAATRGKNPKERAAQLRDRVAAHVRDNPGLSLKALTDSFPDQLPRKSFQQFLYSMVRDGILAKHGKTGTISVPESHKTNGNGARPHPQSIAG